MTQVRSSCPISALSLCLFLFPLCFFPCLTLSRIPGKEEECETGEAESLLQGQAGDGVAMDRDSQSCPVQEGVYWRG